MTAKRPERDATAPTTTRFWSGKLVPTLAAAWLLFLMLWWVNVMSHRNNAVAHCRARPRKCEGQAVTITLAEVRALGEDRMQVQKGQRLLHVSGTLHDRQLGEVALGDDVSFAGHYRDGGIEAEWLEIHPWRPYKRALGILGLALGGIIAAFGLRIHNKRLVIRG